MEGEEKTAKQNTGMIYIIRTAKTKFVKIGYTKDKKTLKRRLESFEVGNPFPIKIEATMPGSKTKERCLHRICIGRHVRGEWFSLTPQEVRRMVSKYRDWNPISHDGVTRVTCITHYKRQIERGKTLNGYVSKTGKLLGDQLEPPKLPKR